MADQPATPWVCPWGICDHDQAQACRAEPHPRKGCGGRFPEGTTPEQAKALISAPPATEGCEFCLSPSFAAKKCPLCGRIPAGVTVVLPAASVRVCTVTDTECPRQCGSDPCRLEQSCAERAANPKPRGAPGVTGTFNEQEK